MKRGSLQFKNIRIEQERLCGNVRSGAEKKSRIGCFWHVLGRLLHIISVVLATVKTVVSGQLSVVSGQCSGFED